MPQDLYFKNSSGDVDSGGGCSCVEAGGYLVVLSAQSCHEAKTVLKNKVYLKGTKKKIIHNMSIKQMCSV